MSKGEELPKTSPAEIENLIEQIRQTNLDQSSKQKVERLLRTILKLVELLQYKNTSIKRLRALIFGRRTERHPPRKVEDPDKAAEAEKADETLPQSPSDPAAKSQPGTSDAQHRVSRKGHGRRAASDYSQARVVKCRHAELKAGDHCPDSLCGGRLYDLDEPTLLVQFTAEPLVTATRYERAVLRCWSCQQRYPASLPEGVKDERFEATADATIALMKYGAGLPFYRQSAIQAMCGVPLSESTLWDRCEAVADAGLGVFLLLERLAADGEVIHTDDTWVRILSCLKEDRTKQQQKGRATNTSGIVVKVAGRKIALYYSGRRHAGENLAGLLKQRSAGLHQPIQMSDALSANWSGEQAVIAAKCLAHARRLIFELAGIYPAQCQVVLAAIGEVYQFDSETAGLSAAERLAYHQEHSAAVLHSLKGWLDEQFDQQLVEPNSSLGKALTYWRNHWQQLTTFLRQGMAPLDNNEAERALKRVILGRKNSLFFKTEHGAAVGDILASLIESCRLNRINAWDYLVTLSRHKSEARRNPDLFLPWTYKREDRAARAA